MKKLDAIRFLVGFACYLVFGAQAVEVGQRAEDFELPGRSAAVKLSDYKGRSVYVDFWASWCGPCKQSFPWMNLMQSRYGSKGFRIIAIDVDRNAEDAKVFLKNNPAEFDIAFDPSGKTPRAYAVRGMPTSFLIGPDGKILLVHNGFRPEDTQALESHIKESLKDQK